MRRPRLGCVAAERNASPCGWRGGLRGARFLGASRRLAMILGQPARDQDGVALVEEPALESVAAEGREPGGTGAAVEAAGHAQDEDAPFAHPAAGREDGGQVAGLRQMGNEEGVGRLGPAARRAGIEMHGPLVALAAQPQHGRQAAGAGNEDQVMAGHAGQIQGMDETVRIGRQGID